MNKERGHTDFGMPALFVQAVKRDAGEERWEW